MQKNIYERSAATPCEFTISYNARWEIKFDCFKSNESGWPMPPDAPHTVTLTIAYAIK
jgi:hypothetical protein